jgi:hypothetical protein
MTTRVIPGIGTLLLGIGVAASAILGPLGLGVIQFRTSANVESQFVGGEIVSLFVVAPLAIVAGVLWLRRHRLAPALTLGPALYAIYTYLTVVVGQEYASFPGNVEYFFPLFAGLIALSVTLAAVSRSRLARQHLKLPGEGARRLLAGVLIAIGVFFALAWAAQIRQVYGGDLSAEYLEAPTLFWTIKLLDLGFVVPVLIATGAGLLRRLPGATAAAYGLVTFCACLALAIAGMALAMLVNGDPSAQPVMLGVTLAAGLGLAGVTVHLFRAGHVAEADDQSPRLRLLPDQPLTGDRRTGAG